MRRPSSYSRSEVDYQKTAKRQTSRSRQDKWKKALKLLNIEEIKLLTTLLNKIYIIGKVPNWLLSTFIDSKLIGKRDLEYFEHITR